MESPDGGHWLEAIRRYVVATLLLQLVWETAQLPLYSMWTTEPAGKQAFAVLHCTGGDGIIAATALVLALAVAGNARWPRRSGPAVWLIVLALGAAYTIYSEWSNVVVRGTWAYSSLMPTLPPLGTGLSPFLQWLVVPTAALWIAGRRAPWRASPPA